MSDLHDANNLKLFVWRYDRSTVKYTDPNVQQDEFLHV